MTTSHTEPRTAPAISVCMPMYNAERYLRECIDSVLAQDFTDFEFLIVDDGSTDRSRSVVSSYNDSRIRLVENKHDYIGSLNLLLAEAKGKYIARMDADDVMMPKRLREQFDYMESHPETDVHVGGLCLYSDENNILASPVLGRPCRLQDILSNNIFANPSTMIRLSCIREHNIAYEQDYIYAEDYRFWARLIRAGARIVCTDKVFMKYRRSAGQVSILHSERMWAVTRKIQEDIIDWITADEIRKYVPPVVKKSGKRLTAIIPFLNEGPEVVETVRSIRETAGMDVDIFVINDRSTDEYPYNEELQPYDVYYFFNRQRMGVAASRDFGVAQCMTPYFILLDAHMRFYDSQWPTKIEEILNKNDRQLLCCQTKVLKKEADGSVHEESIENRPTTYGAYMPFLKNDYLLNVVWNNNSRQPQAKTEPIAVVLGAGYAASKRYWTNSCSSNPIGSSWSIRPKLQGCRITTTVYLPEISTKSCHSTDSAKLKRYKSYKNGKYCCPRYWNGLSSRISMKAVYTTVEPQPLSGCCTTRTIPTKIYQNIGWNCWRKSVKMPNSRNCRGTSEMDYAVSDGCTFISRHKDTYWKMLNRFCITLTGRYYNCRSNTLKTTA